jgi:hypothetical protein
VKCSERHPPDSADPQGKRIKICLNYRVALDADKCTRLRILR